MNKEIIITKEIEPLKDAKLTEVSLEIKPGTEFETWEQIGSALKKIRKSNLWWLADWLNFGERKYGEMYSQALEDTDYDYKTLAHLKQTGDKIEIDRRRSNLSFSHHTEVKGMEPKDQVKWLGKAEEEGWDLHEFRKQIKGNKKEIKDVECEHEKVRCLKCGETLTKEELCTGIKQPGSTKNL